MSQEPNTSSTSSTHKTYAHASQGKPTPTFYTRNHAIVIDIHEDFPITDYVVAVGSLVGPKQIHSASRISNNRICIYLKLVNLVDYLVTSVKKITVQDKEFTLRKMITPAKRLLISNVCSSIPHQVLEIEIKKFGLTMVSPITTLRAGIHHEAYSHVTPPSELFVLLSSTVITHDDTLFHIFFSFDDMTCFLCKQAGHTANRCPSKIRLSKGNKHVTVKSL